MKKRWKVIWSKSASTDLASIAAYIARDDRDAALSALDRLETRATALGAMPLRGRVVPELLAIDVAHYRELVEAPYRIIYRVEERRVLVVAVVDGRRDLERALSLVSRALSSCSRDCELRGGPPLAEQPADCEIFRDEHRALCGAHLCVV